MRLITLILVCSKILAAAAAPAILSPSNLTSLGADLPDDRFRISRTIDATLLPGSATLLNVLYFMGLVATQDFNEKIAPRTWSAPGYRNVEITSFQYTPVRYLLWGIYFAVLDMIESVRFHNTILNLYWDDKLVGRMRVAVKKVLSLPSGSDGDGRILLSDGPQMTQPASSNNSVQPTTDANKSNNATEAGLANELISSWNSATTNFSAPHPLVNAPLGGGDFDVDFDWMPGASTIKRNDVFLAFFLGIIHVARFNIHDQMRTFHTKSPINNVNLHIYRSGYGCTASFPLPFRCPFNEGKAWIG